MKKILTIGLIVFGFYAISGMNVQAVLENAIVKIKSISLALGATVLDIVQGAQPLILSVEVTNTQPVATTVNNFNGTAYMLGQPVANVNENFDVRLAPGETVLIDIPILLDSASVISVVGGAITQKQIPPVNVVGNIVANSFTFPVDETFTFSI